MNINNKNASLERTIDGYPESKTSIKLQEIQTVAMSSGLVTSTETIVDAYDGVEFIALDKIITGGKELQTKSSTTSKTNIKNLVDSFDGEPDEYGIDWEEERPQVWKLKTLGPRGETHKISKGENRYQGFKKLGWTHYFFDVIDRDPTENDINQIYYNLISQRSNDHKPRYVPKLQETSSSMSKQIAKGQLNEDIFNHNLPTFDVKEAYKMIKVFRPSATQRSQHKILRDIQKNLGLETSGVFTSLEGDDAERVAIACGLPKLSTTKHRSGKDVRIVSHTMVHRYLWDLMCEAKETKEDRKMVIRIHSTKFTETQETIEALRNQCITDLGIAGSIASERKKINLFKISKEDQDRVKILGFLPQGFKESSTKLITLTNKQKLV